MLLLPTVVIGLIVYGLFTTRGPLGEWGLLFTVRAWPWPYFARSAHCHRHDRDGGRIHGRAPDPDRAGPWADRWQLCAPLGRGALLHGARAASAFGRIVSEVGIAMMVGGNIKWHTPHHHHGHCAGNRKGEFATGIALGIVLMLVALAVNVLVGLLRLRSGADWRGRA
jgi:tungstate transport system permease protein